MRILAAGRRLTERELEALRLVADGYTTVEVAQLTCYCERTVKNTLRSAVDKLGACNRTNAVALAIRARLI